MSLFTHLPSAQESRTQALKNRETRHRVCLADILSAINQAVAEGGTSTSVAGPTALVGSMEEGTQSLLEERGYTVTHGFDNRIIISW